MIITDQPGRVLAILVFAPYLGKAGIDYKDKFLLFFGILLFIWDLFWIIMYPSKKIDL